jgi:hypothetical protein
VRDFRSGVAPPSRAISHLERIPLSTLPKLANFQKGLGGSIDASEHLDVQYSSHWVPKFATLPPMGEELQRPVLPKPFVFSGAFGTPLANICHMSLAN